LEEERARLSLLPSPPDIANKSVAAEGAVQYLKNLYQRQEHHKLMKAILLPELV
jgi:hypothetical protein